MRDIKTLSGKVICQCLNCCFYKFLNIIANIFIIAVVLLHVYDNLTLMYHVYMFVIIITITTYISLLSSSI